MIIRQSIIDPISGNRITRDIDVRIEELRPTESQKSFMEPILAASCDHHFTTTSPHDKLCALLDGRRTFVPYQCRQTYLTKRMTQGGALEVFDMDALQPTVGDPVAVMSDLKGTDLRYFLIADINHHNLTVFSNRTDMPEYVAGAFVQNLANRWCGKTEELGINSLLSQPEPLPFQVRQDNGLLVDVVTPLNPASVNCYDIYVRNHQFSEIEPHWMADVADVNIYHPQCRVTTFNGGPEAGGNKIGPGEYTITVIAKSRRGRVMVHESAAKFITSLALH